MTFAVAMRVRDGVVALADTRVLRGLDRSKKCKLAIFEHDARQLFVGTSGLRSVTDKVLSRLEDRFASRAEPARRLHEVVTAYGSELRHVRDEDHAALAEGGLAFNSHALIGGQLAGDARPELFLVYPEGNWVVATEDAPSMIIGRSSYGRPLLDQLLRSDASLAEAVTLGYLAFDATRRCSVDVDFPVDVVVVEGSTGALRTRRCEAPDVDAVGAYWLDRQRRALDELPPHLFASLLPEGPTPA
jgi:putative proteasome-type protease